MNSEVKNTLRDISRKYDSAIFFDEPLRRYNTVGIGGDVEVLYMPGSMDEFSEARKILSSSGTKMVVLGSGSNLLITDDRLDAVAVKLNGGVFSEIKIKRAHVAAGASVRLEKLIKSVCASGLSGMEGLVGIPATVGGALKNNASYMTSISECLEKVLVVDKDGEKRWMHKKEIDFGYRYSSFSEGDVILRAVFFLKTADPYDLDKKTKLYFQDKKDKQPIDKKTLGCVFKNPESPSGLSASEMIDKTGLKGRCRGGAIVSEKHANFIINFNKASSEDYLGLMEEIKAGVKDKFDVDLTPEIEVLHGGD